MPSIASQQKINDGPRVFVGYVSYFNFLNPKIDAASFNGHPKNGALYRIIEDRNEFKLFFGDVANANVDGLILGTALHGAYHDQWEFDIKELTTENILDFDISSEDLERLAGWKEYENDDVWKIISGVEKRVPAGRIEVKSQPREVTDNDMEMQRIINQRIQEFLNGGPRQEENIIENISKDVIESGAEAFNTILRHDRQMAETICEMLSYVAQTYTNPNKYSDIHIILKEILKHKK